MSLSVSRDPAAASPNHRWLDPKRTGSWEADEASRLLASIVESSEDAIVSATPDGLLLSWNRAAERLFGYREEEVIGRSVGIILTPEYQHLVPDLAAGLKRGESVRGVEAIGLTKGGERVHMSFTLSPIRNASGEITAAASIIRDITARVRAEEARAFLAAIVESSEDAIVAITPGGLILSWNHGAGALYGYQAEEMLGRPISVLAPLDRREECNCYVARVGRGESVSYETVRARKDGSRFDVSLVISPVRNKAGEIVALGGITRDISRRKRAEEALREREERYRGLVANLPDVVWTADQDGRLIFVSSKSVDLDGYTPEENVRLPNWSDRIHPEDLPSVHSAFRALFCRSEPFDVEYRTCTKDGRWIWVHSRAVACYEKAGTCYVDGVTSDITAHKKSFELIEQLQRRTELILNSAAEGILGEDREGRCTFVNPAAARMLGYTGAELIGQDLHRLLRHSHADRTPCREEECPIRLSLADGLEHRALDDLIFTKSGQELPVEITSAPKMENGQRLGSVLVLRNITEEKSARESLRASLREKDALLREIHHRVKNNLQIVCSLLKLNSRCLQDPEARHIFVDTQHRVKAMALVHEALYQSENLAGIEFSGYVARLAEQLLRAYGLRPGRVKVQMNACPLVLPIDLAVPCALLVTELISNSAKHVFAEAGGGELRITLRPQGGSYWCLQVADSGKGKAGAESSPSGSSFGLELVRLLTEQLNATLHIERTPAFQVTLVFPVRA